MLTDNKNTKKRQPKIRAVDKSHYTWSDKQKIEAVTSWMTLGNLALTSRIRGFPEVTLRVWKASEWWKDVVEDIKSQEKIVLSSKLKTIMDASLAVVQDRLENGNYIYDSKTQTMVRKPVDLKDAHRVSVDLMDKKQVLEKTTDTPQSVMTDEDRLLKLAEKFADLVQKKKTVDVELVEDITPKG